jgi:fatty acid desaturase
MAGSPPVSAAPGIALLGAEPETTTTRGSDFAALRRAVASAGLLDRRPVAYAFRIALTLASYAAIWVAMVFIGNSWWQTLTAVALGLAFTQIAFLGHDGGHQQVFTSRRANDAFGRVLGDLLTGLSYGWWIDKHNRHHANPNKEDHDPDIGDGVLAFTTGQVAARTGRVGRAIARRQAWLFFPLLTLEGINLHVASLMALRRSADRSCRGGSRRTEMVLLTVHLAAYFAGLLLIMSPVKVLVFVAIHQAVWGVYMGCSFAPNHKGMPVIAADEKVDYLRRQVITSRNVRGGWFTDQLLGGLNYQIEHHLFPNMPRASLRHAQLLVRRYCVELDVPYCETSLLGSYVAALRYLNSLGQPLREPVTTGSAR